MLALLALVLFSCKNKDEKHNTNQEKTLDHPNNIVDLDTGRNKPLIITENSFMEFMIGDTINSNSKNLKKEIQQNGEGSFPGYALLDSKGEEIGFIFPKNNNDNIIGIIQISSSEYQTKAGISVGSTYEDLKNKYPNLETHGSEIESRTSSIVGGLSFQLDVYFNTYQIDESKIKPSTRIIKINILGTP